MSSEIKVLAPGRYVGKTTCREENGVYYVMPKVKCERVSHYNEEKKHLNVIINYHIPRIGVITIHGESEKEVDLKSKIVIYEALTKRYLELSKSVLDLEKMIKEIS